MPEIKIETSVSGYCHTTFKISFDYFKYDLTEDRINHIFDTKMKMSRPVFYFHTLST